MYQFIKTPHTTRTIEFNGSHGIEVIIGKEVKEDESKHSSESNLIFDDDDLFVEHAKLVVKKLPPTNDEESLPMNIDSFRIYLESLGDADRIVDLESADSNTDGKIIDLKNGDRFGLVRLDEPVSVNQQRGAKLKFNLNIRPGAWPFNYRIVLTDVTDQKSPCTSRSSDFPDSIMQHVSDESDSENAWSKATDWNEEIKVEIGKEDEVVAVVDDTAPTVALKPTSDPSTLSSSKESSVSGNSHSRACIYINSDSDSDSGYDDHTFMDPEKKHHHFKCRYKRGRGNRSRWSTFRVNKAKGKKFGRKRRFDLYSGSLGFMLGSIGTLGVLATVANFVEG